jgi:exopolyphosphatase/guanosine-5'-triphosphate,3'-diphosphate pyrophosphatase
MKIAVIDLGTNTFNLLIRDTETNVVLYNNKIGVKLGDGGLDDDRIMPVAFERGINALKSHRLTIKEYDVDKTYAFATAAIRSASNGSDFVAAAAKEAGIEVNVIDGQKEAELIYLGVTQALDLGEGTSLIVDIGGGSTEFILANKNAVLWKNSYNIGSSRLLEKFKPKDPISPEQKEAIENFITTVTRDLAEAVRQHPTTTLIGSSGSFDTLANMINEANPGAGYDPTTTSFTFELSQYHQIAEKMLTASYEERLATPGMIPMRADMMPMACIQINYLIKQFGVQTLKLSTYALKEGVFITLKEKNRWRESLL